MIVRASVIMRPATRSLDVMSEAATIIREGKPRPSWWREFVSILIPFGMTAMSDFLEDEILDHILNVGAYTAPTNNHSALFTTATTDAGGGTEVTNANAYARTQNTFGSASSGGSISNSAATTFTQATGSWGTVTHAAIVDNATHGAGNFLFHGALDTSKAVGDTDTFEFATNNITVTMD